MIRNDLVEVVVVGAGMAGAAFGKRLSERALRLRILSIATVSAEGEEDVSWDYPALDG